MDSIDVSVNTRCTRQTICIEIPMLFRECFDKMDAYTDPSFLFCGEVLKDSVTYNKVIKLREDAADILSKEITKALINHMSAFDTINGYKIEV